MTRLSIETVSRIADKMGFMLHKGNFWTAGGHKIARLERRTGYMLTDICNNGVACGADNGFAYTASLQEVIDFLKHWDADGFTEAVDSLDMGTID